MTKGLLYSPFVTTELFYITPGRILSCLQTKTFRPHRRAPRINTTYMNLYVPLRRNVLPRGST